MRYLAAVILGVFLAQGVVFGTKTESEHPPLSESTKKAIAKYKHSPSEENKKKLTKFA